MAGQTSGFRRELDIWEAVGISVALTARSMAANINPQGVIGSVGRAAIARRAGARLTVDQGLAPTREPA